MSALYFSGRRPHDNPVDELVPQSPPNCNLLRLYGLAAEAFFLYRTPVEYISMVQKWGRMQTHTGFCC